MVVSGVMQACGMLVTNLIVVPLTESPEQLRLLYQCQTLFTLLVTQYESL